MTVLAPPPDFLPPYGPDRPVVPRGGGRVDWSEDEPELVAFLDWLGWFTDGEGVVMAEPRIEPGSVLDRIRKDAERKRREEFAEALRESGGNLAEVGRRLGMSRGGVIYRAKKYGYLDAPKPNGKG